MADSAETGIAVTVGPRTSAARLLNAEYLRFVITANASPALSLMQTALLILILILPLRVEGGRRCEETSQRELRQRVAAEEKEGIETALTESRGRVFGPSGAAARLGITRSTLESKN